MPDLYKLGFNLNIRRRTRSSDHLKKNEPKKPIYPTRHINNAQMHRIIILFLQSGLLLDDDHEYLQVAENMLREWRRKAPRLTSRDGAIEHFDTIGMMIVIFLYICMFFVGINMADFSAHLVNTVFFLIFAGIRAHKMLRKHLIKKRIKHMEDYLENLRAIMQSNNKLSKFFRERDESKLSWRYKTVIPEYLKQLTLIELKFTHDMIRCANYVVKIVPSMTTSFQTLLNFQLRNRISDIAQMERYPYDVAVHEFHTTCNHLVLVVSNFLCLVGCSFVPHYWVYEYDPYNIIVTIASHLHDSMVLYGETLMHGYETVQFRHIIAREVLPLRSRLFNLDEQRMTHAAEQILVACNDQMDYSRKFYDSLHEIVYNKTVHRKKLVELLVVLKNKIEVGQGSVEMLLHLLDNDVRRHRFPQPDAADSEEEQGPEEEEEIMHVSVSQAAIQTDFANVDPQPTEDEFFEGVAQEERQMVDMGTSMSDEDEAAAARSMAVTAIQRELESNERFASAGRRLASPQPSTSTQMQTEVEPPSEAPTVKGKSIKGKKTISKSSMRSTAPTEVMCRGRPRDPDFVPQILPQHLRFPQQFGLINEPKTPFNPRAKSAGCPRRELSPLRELLRSPPTPARGTHRIALWEEESRLARLPRSPFEPITWPLQPPGRRPYVSEEALYPLKRTSPQLNLGRPEVELTEMERRTYIPPHLRGQLGRHCRRTLSLPPPLLDMRQAREMRLVRECSHIRYAMHNDCLYTQEIIIKMEQRKPEVPTRVLFLTDEEVFQNKSSDEETETAEEE